MGDTNTKNREIEARFLVCGDRWRGKGDSVKILQGYLSTAKDAVLRLRIQEDQALMTIKGETVGLTRKEYEFFLDDLDKAREVIDTFCAHPIEKIRHRIRSGDFLWEVDEYRGENEGLVIAEVEFERAQDYQRMLAQGKPPWVGKEITEGQWQYTNMLLAQRPFSHWRPEETEDMRQHATGQADDCP